MPKLLKILPIIVFCLFNSILFSQENEKGFYRLSKQKNNKTSNFTFQFQGPDNKAVKSHVKILMNSDTLIPELNGQGIFILSVQPGRYQFKFITPGWYEVTSDTLQLRDKTQLNIFVHFEAQEIPVKGFQK